MYLKTLQLVGFKSFADKTNVEFLPGVTAIVGPNGCGKSNVSDAIRWVLGEQSAKALRGGEMADVIFNGTDSRKPFGMAEVSLTFADCKDVLKTGQLVGSETNFDEVTVTRRIFRDGNSEYFINKTLCRLKDVQNLFMDTGIGRSSYSIMEQGKIDKILSSHPEDRRAIFEEAAGITKFKSQKKEALRKLEYTEANLLRVQDIIKEVKRQIGSIQRQVSKARRYQALSSEIKHLDTQLACHQFQDAQSTIQILEKEANDLKTKIEDIRLEVDAGEGQITNLREQSSATENRRQQILQQQRDLQSQIERQESRIRGHQDRITDAQASIQTGELEASEARKRLVEQQNTLSGTQANLQEAQERLKQQSLSLEEAQRTFQASDEAEKQQQSLVQQLQNSLLGLEGSLASLRNRVITIEKQLQDMNVRAQKLSSERSVAFEEQQKLAQRFESVQVEIQSYKSTFEASRHAVLGGEDALRDAENQCQVLNTQISEEQRLLSEKTSRREVLRQLQKSYEGYSEGAQSLMRELDDVSTPGDQKNHREAILGTLANLIEVEPKYSIAIETALGQALQAIVVAQPQAARDMADRLRVGELGNALFAIQDKNNSPSSISLQRDTLLGTLGWASDVVRAQESVAPFIRCLLADTVIVNNLHHAFELREEHPALTFITLEGESLNHHGILSAGFRKSSPLHLIGRRNEISTLDTEITHLETKLHELSVNKGEWEGRRALFRQSLGDRQSELRLQENDLTKKEALAGALQNELRDLQNRLAATTLEIQELEKQQKEGESDLSHLRHELTGTESSQASQQTELNQGRQRLNEMTLDRNQRNLVVNDLRVAHATSQQQIQGLEAQTQSLQTQVTEIQQLIGTRENELRANRQKIVQLEGEVAEANQQIQAFQESAKSISSKIAEIEIEKTRVESETQVVIESVRTFRQKIDQIHAELTTHEIQLTEKRGQLSHLCERLQREYSVDLNAIQLLPFADPSTAPKKSSAPSKTEGDESTETLTEDPSLSTAPLALYFNNWEEIVERVSELRAKIQSMGPVNLEAVQEFEELNQRHTFLTGEHQDLVTSKDQLLQILQKINVTTRKMFAETFEQIRTNFQTVFTELFGGGKADLLLLDETDPLECGIEIVAKPPGKQLQSILLLSGGEKTMTAVSLLFAIYMVKPSPFCVLDEMDAPLDESNINRFIKMLERFLVHSQFVIITHNKRTIGMADALYGVTMEERGVSKLVSVKFYKKEDRTASQEPSAPTEKTSSRLLVKVPELETSA